jgi:hypothetical protein
MRYRCIRGDYRDGVGNVWYLDVGKIYNLVISDEMVRTGIIEVSGCIFYIGLKNNHQGQTAMARFEDYFVSIEDYRDKQIDELL